MTAASFGPSGTARPSFCGALTTTTRLRPEGFAQLFPTALISSSVIPGRNRWCSAYSNSMPGAGSSCVAYRTYSDARAADCCLSFSAAARSIERSVSSVWRSSSVAVNPNRAARAASVNRASRPRSMPSSFTRALSVTASVARTKLPRPPPPPRNGASGFCASSENRRFSMPE